MKNDSDINYSIKCGAASFAANYIAGIFHPLELLKTRFQSHDGKYNENLVPKYSGIIQGIRDIYKNEGFKGLFKGIHFNIFTNAAVSSLFFFLYEWRKSQLQRGGMTQSHAVSRSGIEAGILVTILTQPIWVIKTWMLLDTNLNISECQNLMGKIREIFSQNGIKGFYKGLSMNLILSFNGALQMSTYQFAKYIYGNTQIPQSTWLEKNFICGGFSKFATTLITYPFTTIRTRIQQNQYFDHRNLPKYKNVQEIVKKMIKQEGVTGFYKGLSANLLRGIPHRGVYFYFYELFKTSLISSSH